MITSTDYEAFAGRIRGLVDTPSRTVDGVHRPGDSLDGAIKQIVQDMGAAGVEDLGAVEALSSVRTSKGLAVLAELVARSIEARCFERVGMTLAPSRDPLPEHGPPDPEPPSEVTAEIVEALRRAGAVPPGEPPPEAVIVALLKARVLG